MTGYQFSRSLGTVYVILGFALFLFITWKFLLHLIGAIFALYLINLGMNMQGYPPSRFIFMAQQWRRRP